MTMRSLRSGATAIPETNVLQLHTDLIVTSGIVDISGTQFQVTANANLTVSTAAGRAYLVASGGNAYPVINDASITTTVNSNSSGNPRITSIVLYLALGNTPGTDGSNTAAIMAVDGTPAASPSAPSSSTIQSAVGGGNPYVVLYNVLIHSGDSNLSTQGVLTDMRTKVAYLFSGDGWTSASDTLTYVSANQFKISGVDRTAIYTKGTRIKFTNNSVTFYGVVASSSFSTDTTVTLFANNDYSIANSAITSPFYSYAVNPQGYPTWFNQIAGNLALGAGGAMTFTSPTVNLYKFSVLGKEVKVVFDISGTTGGTASNAITVSLPVTPDDTNNHYRGGCQVADGADLTGQYFLAGAANISRYDGGNFGLGAGRVVRGMIIYGY